MSMDETYVTTSSIVQRLTDCPSPQGMCPQSDGHLTGGGLAVLGVDVTVVCPINIGLLLVVVGGVTGVAVGLGCGSPADNSGGGESLLPLLAVLVLLPGFGDMLPGLRASDVRARFRGANPLCRE